MHEIDEYFRSVDDRNVAGTLTVDYVPFGYFRLMEGSHKGRTIIKTCGLIEDKPVSFFADTLTWIHTDRLVGIKCSRVLPTFSEPLSVR